MSLIDPGPRSATVKAVIDTECVTTNYDEFNDSITDRSRSGRRCS
jgi:CRP-like cAMP-binding protein